MFSQEKPAILVIDDEPAAVASLTQMLDAAGYACYCFATEEAGLDWARQAPPDLILCDIHLAVSGGPAFCHRWREELGFGDVPLMFLSATQTPDVIHRCHESHGFYYVRKPFAPAVLLELIDTVLSTSSVAR